MNTLQAGFSRVDITPPMGAEMSGYFQARYAEGVLDNLEINALALAVGESKLLLMSADLCYMGAAVYEQCWKCVAEATGLTQSQIGICCTHTHTGPVVSVTGKNGMQAAGADSTKDDLTRQYTLMLARKFADAAVLALKDLKPAKMGWAVGNAPNIAFVRRYRMKDGSVRTNPGVNNPDILHPIGQVDTRVNVLRFDREGAETIVLGNFGCHPDCVGGSEISADWPGFFRRSLEKTLGNVKAMFINGAEGDINHVNVAPKGGEFNHLHMDFDGPRGYGYSRHVGNVVAGAVMQVFEIVNYVDVDSLKSMQSTIHAPSNMPVPEDMPLAHKYNDLHNANRDDEIPFSGMELTTVIADARRKVRLEHGPESFPLLLSGFAIGNVALAGVPGEPFTGIGLGIKESAGWDLVMPCSLCNGASGYFPMQDSYDEGGYEAKTSSYKAGIAELIIEQSKKLLAELH